MAIVTEGFKVADRRQRKYSKVPVDLLRSGVSDRAIRLYATMDAEWINRRQDDPACWPSQELLARMLGTSLRSIERAVAELVKVGAIQVHRVKSGPWPHNVYVYVDQIPEQPDRSGGYPPTDPPTDPPQVSKAPATGDGLSRINDPEREPAPSATGSSEDAPQRMLDRPAAERFDTSLPSYKLCAYFCAMWLKHTPDAKPNISKKWVDEADRMLRIDERDKAEIRAVIDWMFTNPERPYYGNTCHAIPTFRKQYLKIRGEMRTAQQRSAQPPAGQRRSTLTPPITDGDVPRFLADGSENPEYAAAMAAFEANMADDLTEGERAFFDQGATR